MTLQRRQLFAVLLGAVLLLLMLVLGSLGGTVRKPQPPEQLVRREVRMYVPPAPPPPPQATQRAGGGGGRPLAIVSAPSAIKLEVMALDVSVPGAAIGAGGSGSAGLGSGIDGIGAGDTGAGLVTDLGTFDLSALDGYPTVVSSPPFRFPESVARQRVLEFTVHFQIVIDENGVTYPVRIVANPYPELNEQMLDYASKVRFTPPTRLGVRVKAGYVWPVVFRAER